MFRKIKNMVNLFRWGYHSTMLEEYAKQIQDKLDASTIDKDCYIIYHDKFIIGNGNRYASLFVGKRNNLYVPVIVKESKMKKLSDNLNQFTNLHELGHFKYHIDKETGKEYPPEKLGIDLFVENDADAYAAQQMGLGKAVSALQELKQSDAVKGDKYLELYVDLRIQLLTGKTSRAKLESVYLLTQPVVD